MRWEKVTQIGDFSIYGLVEERPDGTKRFRAYTIRGPGVGSSGPFSTLDEAKRAVDDFKRNQSPHPGS